MARRVPVRTLGAAACAAVLALGLAAAPGASAESHDRLAPSSDRAAQRALDVARDALAAGPGPVDRATARNATMALRDLVVHRDELSGADRAAADALLARPTDGLSDPDGYTTTSERVCATDVCVHWVETTSDAVPLTDTSPANGIPDYVDQVLATVQGVHLTYVGAGYREPKPDGGLGGDALTDIYLADVGSDGLYGYCTSDQSPAGPPWDLWAYCVLDNDYAPAQFPTNTPIENMQVTAAHEYFHAVQFGYDAFEDPWFMEASATWAEDELFDDVNDNVFYLNFGQLGSTAESRNPLDTFNTGGLGQYGNWIFLRYLTERLTASQGGMPTLVRDMWRYADASPAGLGLDMVAIQAIDQALRDRGSSFGPRYAQFADANRRSRTAYDEGAANSYPVPPLRFSSVTLSPGSPRTAWRSTSTDHMTSATAQFKPSTKMKSGWKLRLLVDMAGKVRGSRAMVTVYKAGGGTTTSAVTLDSSGNGSKVVGFAKSSVARVELTLVNASMRFQNCWSDGTGPLFFTCFGDPVDDDLVAKQRAIAFR